MEIEKDVSVRRAEALQLMQRKCAIENRIEMLRIIRLHVIDRARRKGMRHFFENA